MVDILIVDDHPAIQMAVDFLLTQDGHSVVGVASNGVDAVHFFKKNMPACVVLDIGIPKLDGIEVIKRIKEIEPSSNVIVLSAQDSHHVMMRCYQAGANGFLSKLDDLSILKEAIKVCMKGGLFFPREVIKSGRNAPDVNSDGAISSLSDREMKVFLSICQGMSNKDIANDMLLSEKTISTYKTRLMQKLQVGNMVELLDVAKRNMLL